MENHTMNDNASPVLFHETLRGLPGWLGTVFVVVGVTGAVVLLLLAREHVAEPVFWLAAGPAVAAAVLAPLAIAMWRLETVVRPGMLAVHLRPFRKREIPLSDVESCEAQKYRPIRDYFGWGWRVGAGGQALTVPGRHGVPLLLRGGARLLISSRRSEELAAVIRSAPLHP